MVLFIIKNNCIFYHDIWIIIWGQILKNLESNTPKNSYKMLASYCTLPAFLMLEYLARHFSEVTLQVPFPRKFILSLLDTCEA